MSDVATPLVEQARAALAGDREALARLLAFSQRSVRAYLFARLRDHDFADDLTQEVLLRASRQLEHLHRPDEWLPWLFGIARNCLREHHRRQIKDQRMLTMLGWLAARRPEYVGTPRSSALLDLVDELDDEQRAVLTLKYVEGLSCKEIAAHLGRPLGSVTSILTRAYSALRERWEDLKA
jgi:RNA polymerase sigma-70 factor (ECF subfamily)